MCLGICQEENEGILEKNHFGPWDAQIFEVAPALIVISNFPFEPNYLFKGRFLPKILYSSGVLRQSYASHSPSSHRDGLKAAIS